MHDPDHLRRQRPLSWGFTPIHLVLPFFLGPYPALHFIMPAAPPFSGAHRLAQRRFCYEQIGGPCSRRRRCAAGVSGRASACRRPRGAHLCARTPSHRRLRFCFRPAQRLCGCAGGHPAASRATRRYAAQRAALQRAAPARRRDGRGACGHSYTRWLGAVLGTRPRGAERAAPDRLLIPRRTCDTQRSTCFVSEKHRFHPTVCCKKPGGGGSSAGLIRLFFPCANARPARCKTYRFRCFRAG